MQHTDIVVASDQYQGNERGGTKIVCSHELKIRSWSRLQKNDAAVPEVASVHASNDAPHRASSIARLLRHADIIHLQRSIGNKATADMFSKTSINVHEAIAPGNRTEQFGGVVGHVQTFVPWSAVIATV